MNYMASKLAVMIFSARLKFYNSQTFYKGFAYDKDAKLVYYRIDDDRLSKVVDAAGGLGGLSPAPIRHSRQPAPGVANFAKLG